MDNSTFVSCSLYLPGSFHNLLMQIDTSHLIWNIWKTILFPIKTPILVSECWILQLIMLLCLNMNLFFPSECSILQILCHTFSYYVWTNIISNAKNMNLFDSSANVEFCNLFSLFWSPLRDGCPRCKARFQANFHFFILNDTCLHKYHWFINKWINWIIDL